MKQKILLLAFLCSTLLFLHNIALAQAPAIQWQKALGGTDNDYAYSIRQTSDGGYLVAGTTRSTDGNVYGNHGFFDVWIVKLNSSGALQWQKCLGGTNEEGARSIQQTSDGGYIVAGYAQSNDGDVSGNQGSYDLWAVKLNAVGDIQWQKCLGGTGVEAANSIQQTSDGGYIIAGSTDSIDGDVTGNHGNGDYWVVKLNAVGDIQWQKCLGGTGVDMANSIRQASDGSFVVAGWTRSNDGDVTDNQSKIYSDFWVVKLNPSGDLQWQKALGGLGDDFAIAVEQTGDGGFIVAGSTESNNGDVTGNHGVFDFWVVKLNDSGAIQWQKTLGGTDNEYANSIQQTSDGGYIVSGNTYSNDGDVTGIHGDLDFWVVKLNAVGDIQWQKCLGGTGVDLANSIEQTSDAGYFVTGFTNSNEGDVTGNHGNFDMWVVKLAPDSLSANIFGAPESHFYPNPVQNQIQTAMPVTSYKINDLSGKLIMQEAQFSGQSIDVSGLAKGMYLLEAAQGETTFMTKFVKE